MNTDDTHHLSSFVGFYSTLLLSRSNASTYFHIGTPSYNNINER